MTDRASTEPKGQSRALRNWSRIRLPTMTDFPPPSSSGMMKFPMLGTNTKMQPVRTPGQRQRQGDVTEDAERPSAEVGGRLTELRVEPLDRPRRAAGSSAADRRRADRRPRPPRV